MEPEHWQKIEQLYNSALEIEPGRRKTFLAEACGGDESLCNEVESLLEHQSESEGFIESSAVEVAARLAASSMKFNSTSSLVDKVVSHYRIVEKLASGGMGVIYKAKDSHLDRFVAIKVLPPERVADSERKHRFVQEARAASALNHPNIITIHDIDRQDGVDFIVMEYIPGKTLNQVIPRKGMKLGDALKHAVQISDALSRAHGAGIIHRDLKPGNIMVDDHGQVKVLDFGLAKLTEAAPLGQDESTRMLPTTDAGTIVGTVAYMSPEQAEGKPLDARSDIFSFGSMLYEMLTGQRPFRGDSSASTLAAILREDPKPISQIAEGLPHEVERVVNRCLRKDPAHRFQTMADLKVALEELKEESDSGKLVRIPAAERMHWRLWPWAFAAAVLLLCAAIAAFRFFGPAPMPNQAAYRFTPFASLPGLVNRPGGVWSPDGKAIAYGGQGSEGKIQIFVRYLDSATPVQVTHLPYNRGPNCWSSDSQRIIFADGRSPAGVWSVAAVGGEPEPFFPLDLTNLPAGDFAPDGKAFAALKKGDDGRWGIWIGTSPDWKLEKYFPDPFETFLFFSMPSLRFAPDGKQILLFIDADRGGEAWLLPYPPDSSHPPRLVLKNLQRYGETPSFSWMPDSRRIVLSTQATPDGSQQLWLADVISGDCHALTSGTTDRLYPAVSPDGRQILFTEETTNLDIVSAYLDGSTPRALIATERDEMHPAWAAKQRALVYITNRNGSPEIWLRTGDLDRPLITSLNFPAGTIRYFLGPALAPIADRVVYLRVATNGDDRLWISNIAGGAPTRLTNESDVANESPGSWSPDGNWFTYFATRNGKKVLMKVKTTGQASPIMLKEIQSPMPVVPSWSPAGDWIAYGDGLISPDGKTMRPLENKGSVHYMFSADGKLLYGIRNDGDRNLLFSIHIASGAEKVLGDLGRDFWPGGFYPGVRFSLAPDGKSFVYSVLKITRNLYKFEGFDTRTGLLARLIPAGK